MTRRDCFRGLATAVAAVAAAMVVKPRAPAAQPPLVLQPPKCADAAKMRAEWFNVQTSHATLNMNDVLVVYYGD